MSMNNVFGFVGGTSQTPINDVKVSMPLTRSGRVTKAVEAYRRFKKVMAQLSGDEELEVYDQTLGKEWGEW